MGDGNDRGMFYLVLPEQVLVRVRRADHGWLCVDQVISLTARRHSTTLTGVIVQQVYNRFKGHSSAK